MTSALPARSRPRLSRPSWLSPSVARTEILAGLVVALALIPEAISFSILAGVDPRVGLYSSFVMAVVIAFTGGRPAMITAATGAIALVVAPLALQYGVEYLFAAVVLGGVFQILLGLVGFARLMRFIPRSVMVGFVNALAILIFTAQLPYLVDVSWLVYPMVAAGLAIIFLLPRLTRVVPAPLVSIVVLTGLTVAAALTVPTVGDQGELPDSLPFFGIPAIPFDLETLTIIAPYALGVAFVGLMESLMTAKLVDDLTDTPSNKTRESWGQGTANIASGFFGGMGGCAMIGQTMINVKSGARTRLSTFLAGALLLVLVVALGDVVAIIPMAALVAVMIFVAIATFDWHSLRTIHRMPRSETAVMLTTVAGTLITHNLAIGVAAGVLVACVLFARRVAHLVQVTSVDDPDGDTRVYQVSGALFFASSNDLYTQFDYAGDPENIVIDLTDAHVWDASTVAALDAITHKYETRGKQVRVVGLTGHSADRYDRHTGQLAGAH
ncbi:MULTISPECIES: SulP family inorganic anion transporter [unclassified Modestobacter]